MTKKTKAPMREGVSKAKPVREGLAFLIEDALERSEVVIAAEAIVEKLQNIAEDLSTIEAKDIMPLLDSLTNAFGPQVAQKFNAVATEQVRQLISSVQGAKTALDGEIVRLKQGVDGGDMSDMGLDAASPMMPGGPPDDPSLEAPGPEGLPPEGDMAPDVGPEDDLALGGNFAGRDKKEGALESRKAPKVRRRTDEDMTARVPVPHSHESTYFNDNLSNLSVFHGGAGRLAQSIANMIRTEELSLDQRKGLASVLSHLAAYASEPAHWSGVDADKKLQMALQSANIWKVDSPALEKIVGQLKRLTHLLSLHHDRMLESNISMLRKATDPDAIILKMFRTKLRENQDGQMAAIRTARAFAIDIEDVVAVVKEAAARRPFPPKLTEFKAELNPAKKGMFKGKDVGDLQKERTALKKRSAAAQDRGEKVPADVTTKEREVNYAIRAKKGWKGGVDEAADNFGGKQAKPFGKEDDGESETKKSDKKANPFGKKEVDECDDGKKSDKFGGKQAKPFGKKKEVEEDAPPLMQGVPMFPVEQGGAATATSPVSTTPNAMDQQPVQMVPSNQSNSTNQPLSPADMRARQTAQQNAQQQQQAVSQVVQNNVAPQSKPAGKPSGMGQPAPTTGQPNANPANNRQPQFEPPGTDVKNTSALKRVSR
jgi:hypothetical protein